MGLTSQNSEPKIFAWEFRRKNFWDFVLSVFLEWIKFWLIDKENGRRNAPNTREKVDYK